LAQNRKFQNLIKTEFIAAQAVSEGDINNDAIITDYIQDDAITNAKTDLHQAKHIKFVWDFATDGGDSLMPFIPLRAAGTETAILPANAVIVGAWLEPTITATSAGLATMKIGLQTNDDAFIAATAFDNGEFTAGAVTEMTNELPLKLVASEGLVLVVGTADLTAGAFNLFVQYYEGN